MYISVNIEKQLFLLMGHLTLIESLSEAIVDMATEALASLNQHKTKVGKGRASKAKVSKVSKAKTKGLQCPYSVGDRVACFWHDNSKNSVEKRFTGTVVAVGEHEGDWSITVKHPAQHGHEKSVDVYPHLVFKSFRGKLLRRKK